MRKTKWIAGTLLALALVCGMTACSGKEPEETVQESVGGQQENKTPEPEATKEPVKETPGPTATPEPTQAPTPTPKPGTTEYEYTIKEFEIPDSEGMRFVQSLKIGWSLGNCFDAYDCTWLSDDMDYETAWCGAKATPELIDALKEAGFNTIRIPVAWHNHLENKDTYQIKKAWLDRVNEVVDYCIDRDMYVIINIHHDNDKAFLYPTSEYLDQSVKYVTSIWKQLSARFQDYDEKLIFAGMNEPRMVGHANEWWIDPNNADCKDAIECINKLNQAFVDTVRATGGNNASRYLICPGYDASPEAALNTGFVFPTDPVDNDHHIILSIHAYTPYNYALESPGTDKWASSNARNLSDMVGFMNSIYNKYVSKGTPVLIDEFGAMEKNGNLESRIDFAGCYVAQARARGMSCIWWDNNVVSGTGERFGLIDRKTVKWVFPEIADAMMKFAE